MLLLAQILATAAISLLISRASITAWCRDLLPQPIRQGVECPFCVSFWVAAALVGFYGPDEVPLLLAIPAVWGGASVAIGLAEISSAPTSPSPES